MNIFDSVEFVCLHYSLNKVEYLGIAKGEHLVQRGLFQYLLLDVDIKTQEGSS